MAEAEEKVPCTKCGAMILPVTAANNQGRCMPCAGKSSSSVDVATDVADGIGCLVRLGLGLGLGGLLGVTVFAATAKFSTGLALFAGIGGFVVGFALGALSPELRLLLGAFLD